MLTATGSVWGMLTDLTRNGVFYLTGTSAPVNGVNGSGANFAGPGSNYVNTTTGAIYINIGTKAAPYWASEGIGIAQATYDFAVDGGAAATITFAKTSVLPLNAIVIGGIIDVLTPGTGAGSMSIGTLAGSSATSIKAATLSTAYTGLVATTPVFSAATAFKMTASGVITGTISGGTITAGKWNVFVFYVIGGLL